MRLPRPRHRTPRIALLLALLCTAATGRASANPCLANATTLCAHGGRFAVTVDWTTANGTGEGVVAQAVANSGFLYFFDPDNIELVVKVLDGCGVNEHYWVFLGGLTDQGVDAWVTDTKTGKRAHYANPLHIPFATILDIDAFATCP